MITPINVIAFGFGALYLISMIVDYFSEGRVNPRGFMNRMILIFFALLILFVAAVTLVSA